MRVRAKYTNDRDYFEPRSWNVIIIGFVSANPEDHSRRSGTLGEQPCAVCVFDEEDGRLEAIPLTRLRIYEAIK